MNNSLSVNRNVDVFISYSSKDEETANLVVDGLSARGVQCWKAGTYTINSGEDFRQKIADALDECKIFLIILSEHSMSSPWCKLELTEALRKNKKIYSLKVDGSPIDELFDFKLGCSQTSDGTKNLIPVVENLSINIKKDRDALLEREKTQIYSAVNSYHFFNLSVINNIFLLLFFALTIFRMFYAYNNAAVWEDPFMAALYQTIPFMGAVMMYAIINVGFWSIVKKYAQLGCPSAEYLMFKKYFGIFSFGTRKKQALSFLQNAAKGGDHRALIKLSKMLESGKHVKKDQRLSDEYRIMASEEKRNYFKKITKNKTCFALMITFTILIAVTYYVGTFML